MLFDGMAYAIKNGFVSFSVGCITSEITVLIHYDSKLLVPVVYFDDTVSTWFLAVR